MRYIAELSEWVGDAYDIPSSQGDGIKQDYREIWYTAISSLFTKDVFFRDLIEEETASHHPNASLEWFLSRDPARGLKGGGRPTVSSWVLWVVLVYFCNVVCIRAGCRRMNQGPSAKRSSTEQ